MLLTLVQLICWVVFIYLGISALYLFISALAGRIIPSKRYISSPEKKRIAVLLPTYKEDAIIVHSALMAKKHNYPADKFEVYVAADSIKPETIQKLRAIPVQVLEVSFEKSSKARSLNQLLNSIPVGAYDVALVLDADNVMLEGCMESINAAFQSGYKAVQVHRTSKNKNTTSAVLDSLSEEVNNHMYRRGVRALGFSSALIGSGMAFEFEKLKEVYNKPGILGNPACDREVDFEITRAGIVIEFIDNAIVLDEKVGSQQVFERQRTRWLESQIIHLRLFFKDTGWAKQTKHYWNKLLNNMMLPRSFYIILFGLAILLGIIDWISPAPWMIPARQSWFLISGLFFGAFILSIPTSFYNFQTFKALLQVPVLLFSMVRALFKMKVSREEFLHTPKEFTQEVDGKVQ